MARVATDVLVGTAEFYTAPQGEAYPTDSATAVAGNWEDIGYSDAGWVFAVDKTFEDVLVAEEADPLRVLKTAQEIRLRGISAQATLETLQLAMGGGTITTDDPGVGFNSYAPPVSDAFTEYSLLLRALAPPGDGSRKRDIQGQRAVATGAFEMSHNKAPDKTAVAIDWRLIVPTSGNIFFVIDDVSS